MKEILEILEKDARATPEQIATMTGLSVDEVRKTIAQAEKERILLKYRAIINWEKLGEELVWALVEVKVSPEREVGFDSIAHRIAAFPETRFVYLVSGTYDLLVLVAGKNLKEVASFISQRLAPLDLVQGTVTHFLLKRYKDNGDMLEGEEGAHRLPLVL